MTTYLNPGVTEGEALYVRCCSDVGEHCVASKCMAWRWLPDQWYCRECKTLYLAINEPTIANGICPKCDEVMDIYRTGYCGLGGKFETE